MKKKKVWHANDHKQAKVSQDNKSEASLLRQDFSCFLLFYHKNFFSFLFLLVASLAKKKEEKKNNNRELLQYGLLAIENKFTKFTSNCYLRGKSIYFKLQLQNR